MIDLKKLSKGRLKESQILYSHRRYDTSTYLCGYAVELALKYRIGKCLKWIQFPETNAEFGTLKPIKSHDYETLLRLTGRSTAIKSTMMPEWSVVLKWSPENRYYPLGTIARVDCKDMMDSAEKLVGILCGR